MKSSLRLVLLASVTASCPLIGASARAAEAAAAPAAAQPGGAATTIVGEVIVTAEKRSESVQKVPLSITALDSSLLQQRGVGQVSDLRFSVPSMQVGKQVGNTDITIRGIGNNLTVAAGWPAVAIHVDGVYQPIAGMGDLAQVDLERVEVLRGPQGTLYGRNANAGVVNFISKAPTDRFEGYAQAGYSSYNQTDLQAVVNVPINDRIRARGVISYMDRQDGFVKNVLPHGQDIQKGTVLSGRLRVDVDITDQLKLDLETAKLASSGPFDSFTLRGQPTPPTFAGAIAPQEPWRTSVNDPVNTDIDYSFDAATFTLNLDNVQLKSISAYQRHSYDHSGDDDGTNLSLFVVHRTYLTDTFTQEFDASGKAGPVDWVAGAFYMNLTQDVNIHYFFPAGISILPPNSQQQYIVDPLKDRAIAAFTDLTLHLNDRLRLIAGFRVSQDKFRITQTNSLNFGPTAAPVFTCNNRTGEVTFNSATPRLGAQYDLSDTSNVYATYSKGFKAGGYNRNNCNQSYMPEKITAYELGIKNRFLDNTLTLNASVFYYDYTNLQLSQQVGLAQQITNAAAATIKGVEFESLWAPDSHWTVNASLSFLDATYDRFTNVDPLQPGLGVQNLAGNTLDDAPKESANLGVAYRTDELPNGRFTLRADAAQRSLIHFREFAGALNEQQGYTLVNLAVIWDSPTQKYQIRLYGNNVGNKGYIVSLNGSQANGSRFVTWGDPRQYGISFRTNF